MSFTSDTQAFTVKVFRMEHDVFVGCTEEVQRSIVEGSEITAAPGQPVDTGALRNSWTPQFTSETEWQTSTHLIYAPVIEDNLRGATLKSAVGGFFSVRLTRLGFPRIVEVVTARVRGASA